MYRLVFLILTITLQIGNVVFAQNNSSDSLSSYTLNQLEKKFYKSFVKDKEESRIYALQYLKRVKQDDNSLNISKGYYFIIKSSERADMLVYSDSLIEHAKKHPGLHYTGIAHYLIGTQNYLENKQVQALDRFMIADSILSKTDTVIEKYWVKQAIGMLKLNSKDYDGALKEYLKSLRFYQKTKDWSSYSTNAFSLYILYVEKNQLDSAEYFVDKALKSIQGKNIKQQVHLEYAKGVIEFKRGNINNSINSFERSRSKLDSIGDYLNLAFSESYLGESYLQNHDTLRGIPHLKKAASYFKSDGFTHSGVRSAMQTLAEYYRIQRDDKTELEYLKLIISLDSINFADKNTLQDQLYKNYDLPNNIKRKNEIINRINEQSQQKSIYLISSIFLVVCLAILIFFLVANNKRKIKLYKKIIEEYKTNSISKKVSNPQSKIPEKDIQILNEAFLKYENEVLFTKNTFNKEFIRKDTGINDHYIADYMRDFIGSSFSQYVNDKRTELAIKKILEDTQYSKYTMQAMALDVGYNNSATFKRAFKQRVGLTPLEFIKKAFNS